MKSYIFSTLDHTNRPLDSALGSVRYSQARARRVCAEAGSEEVRKYLMHLDMEHERRMGGLVG